MQKQWSAGKIMDALEKLHPHFYLQPVQRTVTSAAAGEPKQHHLQAIESPLPKPEFLKLYYKCGDMLHRGNVKKLLKGQFPHQINFPEITAKAQKLVDLLTHHVMVMHSGEQMFIAMLRNAEGNNRAQVAIAETPKGQPIDYTSPAFLRDPASK
jgi:hypothetical protein